MLIRARKNLANTAKGCALGLSVVVIMCAFSAVHHKILNPNLIFALAVVYSAYRWGMFAGLLTSIIAILYTAVDWSVTAHMFWYTRESMQKLIIVIICMPAMAALVGHLKRQSDKQQRMLTIYARGRSRNLKNLPAINTSLQDITNALPVCAWCKRIRNTDGKWDDLELYLHDKYHINITHGICHECATSFKSSDPA